VGKRVKKVAKKVGKRVKKVAKKVGNKLVGLLSGAKNMLWKLLKKHFSKITRGKLDWLWPILVKALKHIDILGALNDFVNLRQSKSLVRKIVRLILKLSDPAWKNTKSDNAIRGVTGCVINQYFGSIIHDKLIIKQELIDPETKKKYADQPEKTGNFKESQPLRWSVATPHCKAHFVWDLANCVEWKKGAECTGTLVDRPFWADLEIIKNSNPPNGDAMCGSWFTLVQGFNSGALSMYSALRVADTYSGFGLYEHGRRNCYHAPGTLPKNSYRNPEFMATTRRRLTTGCK